jgi:hypothetical protein
LQQDLPHAAIGRVAVRVERGERGEARRGRVPEQLADIVDLAVEVARQEPVVRLRPGGARGIMVAVDVEGGRERGLRLDLDPVVVEVERERIDALPDRGSDY